MNPVQTTEPKGAGAAAGTKTEKTTTPPAGDGDVPASAGPGGAAGTGNAGSDPAVPLERKVELNSGKAGKPGSRGASP